MTIIYVFASNVLTKNLLGNAETQIVSSSGSTDFFLVTSEGLYVFNPGRGSTPLLIRNFPSLQKISVHPSDSSKIVLAGSSRLDVCKHLNTDLLFCNRFSLPTNDPVTALKYAGDGSIYVATNKLYGMSDQGPKVFPMLAEVRYFELSSAISPLPTSLTQLFWMENIIRQTLQQLIGLL
jgi:hypothetical protein